jgi:hypothetical protein
MSIAVTSGTNLTNGIKITSAFDPTQIFVNNEQGYWLDPNDFDTMFQDPVGTTPVTAVGQGVRLMLDKSKGLVPGPEIITPQTNNFTQLPTQFTSVGLDVTFSNGVLRGTLLADNVARRIEVSIPTVPGRSYLLTYDANSNFGFAAGAWVNVTPAGLGSRSAGPTTQTVYILASSTTATLRFYPRNSSGTQFAGDFIEFSSFSVREVPGNHFTQANTANAPILGRNPIVGTRNLLTFTEEFNNAAWTKNNCTVTEVFDVTPPTSGMRVWRLTSLGAGLSTVSTIVSGEAALATFSVFLRQDTWTGSARVQRSNNGARTEIDLTTGAATNATGALNSNFGAVSFSNSWLRGYATTVNTNSGIFTLGFDAPAAGQSIYITGAMREEPLASPATPTPYQRVGTAFDVTESGIQTVHYLAFDGTDDWLQSVSTINPGNIDKVQVFAGVRKLSDVARCLVVESSSTVTSNSGAFAMNAPFVAGAADYNFTSRGNIIAPVATSPNNFVAPITNVLTGIADISADILILRVNGTQVASNTTDQGTGNYLTYIHYIGRRGGTTFALNGRIYQLITRYGPNLTTQQIQTVENYVTNNTLFTIGSLFTNNTGALLESFDQTTLFQDDIGTQPVTATGQAVGLWLDKSRGLGFGTELIINGEFSQGSTQWNTTANVSITNNQAVFTNAVIGNAVAQVVPAGFVPSRSYQITYTITSITSGSVSSGVGNNLGAIRSSPGTYTDLISSPTNNFFIQAHTDNTNAVIDNVSVRELYGNHAIQSTAAAKPLYQTTPARLTLDRVDDRLVMTVPSGGFVGTMVLATPEGTAAYGVNIPAGSYNIGGRGGTGGQYFPGTAMQAYIIRNGALTQGEIDQAITYLRDNGGGPNYGAVTNFNSFWRARSELTAFPVIDTSAGTNFFAAWDGCSSLTSFPLINTAAGTNFPFAWRGCSSLASFPLINTAAGTNFQSAWDGCSSLTSFPLINTAAGTNFFAAWRNCSSLTTFPANFFNGCAATNFTNAFTNTNLTQASIDGILVSIESNGTSGGTFNQSGGSAPSATGQAAITALRSRGWTVTVTGGF